MVVVLAIGGGLQGANKGGTQTASESKSQSDSKSALDTELKSITAEYTGSTDANTAVTIKNFNVTGNYANDVHMPLLDCELKNPGSLVGNQETAFEIDCDGKTAVVKVTGTVPVPAEYKNALKAAERYSSIMHMSKRGIYDQLTSEYGEKFSAEAAQYAVDNLQADYNANALQKAKDYQNTMGMSPEAIRDQLISDYGEKFTPEEAEYAIQHLND